MTLEISESRFLKNRSRLLKRIYKNDPYYRSTENELVKLVLKKNGHFAKRSEQMMFTVSAEDKTPLVSVIFIIAEKYPSVLQVSFFEALPKQDEAVDVLFKKAIQIARIRGVKQIVIGLNGHVNYGLGFLAGPFNSSSCFGSCYSPPYYIDYLKKFATKEHTLVSYTGDFYHDSLESDQRLIKNITKRFHFRTGNFKDLRREIAIYTDLNNHCFASHPFYYERSFEEDYELFKSFGPFLKEENFLIAEIQGRPVGFLLWYPDFHELIPPGKSIGVLTLLKYRLFHRPISRFKIVEIGVLPEYHGTGVIGGLINMCCQIAQKNHRIIETGWILDTNMKSKSVARRWIDHPYKTYKAFEINLE